MALFDRHKPSGEFFPVGAAPVVQQVHHHHSNNDVDREIFNKVLQQRDSNANLLTQVSFTSLERRAINAGLRAALREALKALREQNPRHTYSTKRIAKSYLMSTKNRSKKESRLSELMINFRTLLLT